MKKLFTPKIAGLLIVLMLVIGVLTGIGVTTQHAHASNPSMQVYVTFPTNVCSVSISGTNQNGQSANWNWRGNASAVSTQGWWWEANSHLNISYNYSFACWTPGATVYGNLPWANGITYTIHASWFGGHW